MTLPRHAYRDPLEQLLEKEARTCKGCAFAVKVLGCETCTKGRKIGTRCRQYIEREGKAMLQRSNIPSQARQQDPVEYCLSLWAWWMKLDDRDLGVKGGSRVQSDGEAAGMKRDIEIAEATDAMIEGLSMRSTWAIRKKFGLSKVWRYPNADMATSFVDAVVELEPKLKKNLATRTLFG